MKKNNKLISCVLALILFVTMSSFIIGNNISVKANDASLLSFTADNWNVESGNINLSNSNEIVFDKDIHNGGNKAILHTTQSYSNYHLSFKMRYESNSVGDPWYGRGGILLHSDQEGLDGHYIGFYNWDNLLWLSNGWYVDNNFHHNYGIDAGWGQGTGLAENQYDIYVQDGHCQIIINNWICMNAPLAYKTQGCITLVSEGISATYKDITVTPLGDDFDLSERIVRPNWGGSNLAGCQAYWYEAGKDQMFKMSLPADVSNVKTYYLARSSKTRDKGQDVDVYIDKTGTLTFDDTWETKAVTWGDAPTFASDFGTNMVEIPKSYFEGCTDNQMVGFYLDKNVDAWYCASNYYLLYEDNEGVLRVSDFLDLQYQFDKDAHSFVCDTVSSFFSGYIFFDKDAGLITSHYKGQEVEMIKLPELSKLGDVSHNFEYGAEAITVDMSKYLKVNKNHTNSVIKYSVDGGPLTDTVVLENKNASGVITAVCQPGQLVVDGGGWVYFDDIKIDIPYTTSVTLPNLYIEQSKELNLYVNNDTTTINLLDYVSTNIEGPFSYTYDGKEVQGTMFTVPNDNVNSSIVLTAKHELGDKTVTLPFFVTTYKNPSPLELPHTGFDGFVALDGTPNIVDNVLNSNSENNCDMWFDTGVSDYVFQADMYPSTDAGNVGTYGILLHASMSTNGLSGTLLAFDSNSGRIDVSIGYLNNGVYSHYSSFDAGFSASDSYPYKVVVQGSTIVVMINGYRIFEFSDRYYSGSEVAILNNNGTINYKNIKINEFNDDISTYAIRKQWSGIDTYAKVATFGGDVEIDFIVPNADKATNFRLVRRTSLWETAQNAKVYVDGKDYGEWSFNYADWYGDIVYPLTGLTTTNDKVTVKVSPIGSNTFKASYMWLIYTIDGVDYVADCVYFGDSYDVKAHNVKGSVTISGQEKCFIINNNGMLLTVKSGEKVVWAQDPYVTDKMEAKVYEDASISSTVTLPYRLYLPTNYDASKKYPVLVFMHGAGERGNNNIYQVTGSNHMQSTHILLNRIILGEYADDFIVVAPQCPEGMRWVESDWTPGKYNLKSTATSTPTKLLTSLLYNDIFENYSVDLGRVYGAGLSMGGFGITDLAMREPGLFAAIVNCAGGADASQYELLNSTALRVYHSTSDTTVNNAETLALVNALKTDGKDAQYYEVNRIGHESWIVAFEDADLITWMLSKKKTWSIEVNTDGGTFNQELPSTYSYEDKIIKLEDVVKEGFTFDGWYLDSKYTQKVEEISLASGKNIKLYAKFVKQVNVNILSDDESLASLTLNTGDQLELSQYNPVKEGHILIGYTDGINNYRKNDVVTVTEDMTLTARWQIQVLEVKFLDGDETIKVQEVNYGSKATALETTAKEGYEFKGWYLNEVAYSFDAEVKESITLTAKWQIQVLEVKFVDGDKTLHTKNVNYGSKVSALEVPAKEGYEFKGWYLNEELYDFESEVKESLTLTAMWEAVFVETPNESGCGGSILASIHSLLALAAISIFLVKKRKEQR